MLERLELLSRLPTRCLDVLEAGQDWTADSKRHKYRNNWEQRQKAKRIRTSKRRDKNNLAKASRKKNR